MQATCIVHKIMPRSEIQLLSLSGGNYHYIDKLVPKYRAKGLFVYRKGTMELLHRLD